mgnify:FL=1
MSNMKKVKKIMVLFLCAMLITVPVFTETASAAATKTTSASARKGWYRLKNGNKKYFKNGKYLTGCQKIGKNVYLFNKYGVLMKKDTAYKGIMYYIDNRAHVEGWKKGSVYYYKNGTRMGKYKTQEFRAYQNAKDVVDRVTTPKMSKSQKLEACFRWVMSKYYHTWRRFDQGGAAWYAVQANDHFERGCGDCIADASAFAYLAKVLGYTNVYICADAPRSDDDAHAWTEINGRVYDPLFAEAKSYSRNYNVSYGVYILSPEFKKKLA